MIEQTVLISLLVFALHYTLMEGEIFGSVGTWFSTHLPVQIHDPVFDCVVCMAPWYGTLIYWLVWGGGWPQCGVVVIAAMGLNSIVNRFIHCHE